VSSNIPAARAAIESLITQPDLTAGAILLELQETVLPLLHRTRTKPRVARREAAPVDAQVAQLIRDYAAIYPAASTLHIAKVFSTNPGRVSEAIAGLR
jgi:hypothetical protein